MSSTDAPQFPAETSSQSSSNRRFWRWWVGGSLVVVSLVILAIIQIDWTSSESIERQARSALERKNYVESLRLGRRLMNRSSHRDRGLLFVAESTAKLGRFDEAVSVLEQVSRNHSAVYVTALLLKSRIECDDLHRPAHAERTLRAALQVDPGLLPAHEKLSFILGLAGRNWEAVPHRLALVERGRTTTHLLALLSLGNTASESPQLIERCAADSPDDPLIQCGLARIALRDDRIEDAIRLLESAIQTQPTLLAAHAWKGEILLSCSDEPALQAWSETLPTGADEFPEIWFVRGGWAVQRDDPRVAARCFWECLRRDPCHQAASYQLANLLGQLGEQESAELFRRQARLLGDLITAARVVEISASRDAAIRAGSLCESLGFTLEAHAWQQVLRQSTPTWKPEAGPGSHIAVAQARLDPQFDPTRKSDLSSFPLPTRPIGRVAQDLSRQTAVISGDPIRFHEQAKEVGIDFLYRNGSRPETENEFMYEFSGGGVAAIDYDQDGWSDLYFTQGSVSPPQVAQTTELDRLYRNLGNGRFDDVTTVCGIRELGFGQGCAAGDFDGDGFPDLYVANIGMNCFYRNNGDGTFSDVTEQTGAGGDRWSTSCAIADFNGDGNPDLFVVNYVTGKDVLTKPCRMADGSPRLCTPIEFPAAHDQLYINLGDGRFENQSVAAGIEAPDGKGLGVVASAFDRSGRINLFVANDAVPNFYFENVTAGRGQATRFEERGYISGLAVDADGQSQACMGVASGDANGDGLLDLYISNFRNESNTLYLQQPDGTFLDATRTSGLREPSYAMLGFGTQFLDADLDGWEDLVLTNGHVGNLKHHGIAYEMPPQFFQNRGQGRFVELRSSTLGPFFASSYLGRGMARLDWNRDGRDDFVISHLKSPAALVTNQAAVTGRSLIVHLRGVESDRDAIGSIVTITAGGRRQVRYLSSGDGYQASNQKQLTFGLGQSELIDQLEVQWPNGKPQTFHSIRPQQEILLIEGRAEFVTLAKP